MIPRRLTPEEMEDLFEASRQHYFGAIENDFLRRGIHDSNSETQNVAKRPESISMPDMPLFSYDSVLILDVNMKPPTWLEMFEAVDRKLEQTAKDFEIFD